MYDRSAGDLLYDYVIADAFYTEVLHNCQQHGT
jgi:hypothetical protein